MTQKDAFEEWLAHRPECIKKLAKEFPLGTIFIIDGKTLYLVGYSEEDGLLLSTHDPAVAYEEAKETMQRVCAKHFRGVKQ